MGYDEFLDWAEYIKRRGTLHTGMRLEFLIGRLSWIVHHALGGKEEFSDMVRYHDEHDAGIDSLAKVMGVKEVRPNG